MNSSKRERLGWFDGTALAEHRIYHKSSSQWVCNLFGCPETFKNAKCNKSLKKERTFGRVLALDLGSSLHRRGGGVGERGERLHQNDMEAYMEGLSQSMCEVGGSTVKVMR